MGLFGKIAKSVQDWVNEDQTSIFESPPQETVSRRAVLEKDLLGRKIEGETVAVQKIYQLICDSINGNYFDIESAGIISGIIGRLKYPLEDRAVADLYQVLSPIYKRNFDACTENASDIKQAKDACLRFIKLVEDRPNDGLGPYVGKGFSVTGTFLYGTQKEVVAKLASLGCTKVENNYSVNYADYIFIGCKPNKRHPSEDFSDLVTEYNDNMEECDGFTRLAIAEYDFEPLK